MDCKARLSIVRRADAEYGAEIAAVINSCTTWGEVRQMASPRRWTDLLGRTGYGGIEEFTRDLSIGHPFPGAEACTEAIPLGIWDRDFFSGEDLQGLTGASCRWPGFVCDTAPCPASG